MFISINRSLNIKLRPDLSINSRDEESLSIEILFYTGADPGGGGLNGVASLPPLQMKKKRKKVGFPQTLS